VRALRRGAEGKVMTKSDDEVPKAEQVKPKGSWWARFEPKWKIFWIVSTLSLVADQVTKIWARASLPVLGHGTGAGGSCVIPDDIIARQCGGAAVKVIEGYWDWRLSMNPGSAFGLFGSFGASFTRVFLSLVGVGAVVAMVFMLKKARSDQRVLHWALALVAGGAVGNLIDRIYFSVVTDFILWKYKTHEWPVFNIADIVLVVGVGLMFIDIQKENKREKLLKEAREAKAREQGLVKDLKKTDNS
jgi:signal peptidase II